MKKMNLKEIAAKLGERVAKNSVGKSIPYAFYEPKVPTSLREQESKECK